jgi:hypothetical protein
MPEPGFEGFLDLQDVSLLFVLAGCLGDFKSENYNLLLKEAIIFCCLSILYYYYSDN